MHTFGSKIFIKIFIIYIKKTSVYIDLDTITIWDFNTPLSSSGGSSKLKTRKFGDKTYYS